MDMGSLLHQFLQQLINGISLGSIYALIALGYTMIYGILKLINFAHGDIYMLGAYFGFVATTMFGFSFLPAILLPWLVQPLPVLSLNALPIGRCATHRVLLF